MHDEALVVAGAEIAAVVERGDWRTLMLSVKARRLLIGYGPDVEPPAPLGDGLESRAFVLQALDLLG